MLFLSCSHQVFPLGISVVNKQRLYEGVPVMCTIISFQLGLTNADFRQTQIMTGLTSMFNELPQQCLKHKVWESTLSSLTNE